MLALVDTALHAKFALTCMLDECMAATARAAVACIIGVAHTTVAVHVAVVEHITSIACIAIVACLAILTHAFALLVYFTGVLVSERKVSIDVK